MSCHVFFLHAWVSIFTKIQRNTERNTQKATSCLYSLYVSTMNPLQLVLKENEVQSAFKN